MTGALIGAGSGLALGIGFLIWALSERNKRYAAERGERDADADRARFEAAAARATEEAARQASIVVQRDDQITRLQGRLDEARKRLAACQDPQAIHDWLVDELRGETL